MTEVKAVNIKICPTPTLSRADKAPFASADQATSSQTWLFVGFLQPIRTANLKGHLTPE
jgi:hypothetical protein